MRVNKKNKKNKQDAIVSWVFQGLFTSILISLLVVFVVTMYVFFSDIILTDATLKIIFTVTMLTSIFFGALLSAYQLKRNGLILGIVIGGLYAGTAILLSQFISVNIGAEMISLTKVLTCMGAGALGGMIGVNL